MKKIIFSFSLLLIGFSSMAQSDQYKNGMKSLFTRIENTNGSPDAYQEIANGFTRIADAEKSQWLPKYYASFCLVMKAMLSTDKQKVDGILDQADKILSDIASTTQNDEVMCLQAFSKSTRIGVDPQTRGMKYGMESSKLLAQAKALNPNNPRVYFLQGQSAFYTPEAFGGGKAAAKKLFQTSVDKYESNKPTDELMPNWGKESAMQMLAKCSE